MFQSSTISFLKDIKLNNNKPWFDENKPRYLEAKSDFENFVNELLVRLSTFDIDMKDQEGKKCMFRINRDIRFSKNKTPYKINLAGSFIRGGKKSIFAGYYFHLEPGGKSFAGGGLWMPTPDGLKKIRQEIDYCLPEFEKIIHAAPFKKQYGELEREKGQVLVNIPKGYEKDNPAAEYLKLKSFIGTKIIPDKMLTSPDLLDEVTNAFKALHPLLQFINRSLEN